MNKMQVEKFFVDRNLPCPITERLIKAGYKQTSGGYISTAKKWGVKNPTQYWHLIHSWCGQSKETATFGRNIVCGELIFWMAEVSGIFSDKELNNLADNIITHYLTDRKNGNALIQEVCFDRIKTVVESTYKNYDSGFAIIDAEYLAVKEIVNRNK